MPSLSSYLQGLMWDARIRTGRVNVKIDADLHPVDLSALEALPVNCRVENLSSEDYRRMVATPALAAYRVHDYLHSKPLEYLTTVTLLQPKPGADVLDAAGGSDAEYIRAIREFTGLELNGYVQDARITGSVRDGVRFIGGSIDAVAVPDASFDCISCHHSLEHFRGDLDSRFVIELGRLLKPGGRAVITPLFVANSAAEIWNKRPDPAAASPDAKQIFDRTAAFAGWGPYEGFARVYSVETLRDRVLTRIPEDCTYEIVEIRVDGAAVPDLQRNRHQPKVNGNMKALAITRNR